MATASCVLAVLVFLSGGVAFAQTYPSKPIRLILPFPPGGSTDIVARLIGQKLIESWGQPVLVDNQPGAGGNIAAETAAKAAPDGHTLFQVNVANAIGATLYPKLNYDLITSFAPVIQLATTPYVLLAHPSVPAKNTRELVALAKARRGELNYASAAPARHASFGGAPERAVGHRHFHVPYKAPARGHCSLIAKSILFHNVPASVPLVKKAGGCAGVRRASSH